MAIVYQSEPEWVRVRLLKVAVRNRMRYRVTIHSLSLSLTNFYPALLSNSYNPHNTLDVTRCCWPDKQSSRTAVSPEFKYVKNFKPFSRSQPRCFTAGGQFRQIFGLFDRDQPAANEYALRTCTSNIHLEHTSRTSKMHIGHASLTCTLNMHIKHEPRICTLVRRADPRERPNLSGYNRENVNGPHIGH